MRRIFVILILSIDLCSRANDYRKFLPRCRTFCFEKREVAILTENRGSIHRLRQLTYDEKRLVKKGESIIKLAFYSTREQIERRAHGTGMRGGRVAVAGPRREGAEYKVTSHVYFIPVDPIKVPIIISDVFRCNMFDLVSDIL